MNKKLCKTLGLAILLASSLPFSLVSAETVEEVPTGETTISSMADDPLKEYKEKAANQVSSIKEPKTEETESESKKETEMQTTEDTPTTESSAEDTPNIEEKLKRQPRGGGGIRPFSTNLIEDPGPSQNIDADFAKLLRTDPTVQNLGISWTGYNKAKNQLTDDDMAALTEINVSYRTLTSLKGIEYAANLIVLDCQVNNLIDLNVSKNVVLKTLDCRQNQLTNIDVSKCVLLENLWCSYNSLISLDVSKNTALKQLMCDHNLIGDLDVTKNIALTFLDSMGNPLQNLDVSKNLNLGKLYCAGNQLTKIDVSKNALLYSLDCMGNSIESLDLSNNPDLKELWCHQNQLKKLDLTVNTKIIELDCSYNKLTSLEQIKQNSLISLNASNNQIFDITPLYGLSNLIFFDLNQQNIYLPIPSVISGQTKIEKLKTSNQLGLSLYNSTILGSPIITPNGDDIIISNTSRDNLSEQSLNFKYDETKLIEGANSGYTKEFSGTIHLFSVSELANELTAIDKKVKSGDVGSWTWVLTSLTTKKSENIHAKINLPPGLVIEPSSIKKNGISSTLADINGTNNLGDLNQGESIVFTFETTATGSVDQWLEAEGRLDWEDNTITSPYHNESKGRVQIQDDEQTYTPKDTDDMSIQSVPVYFNHGTNPIMSTAQTYHLHSMNYQSNTKVVTDGFYTRIKDDRPISTGWKLTAKLSDFKDSSNAPMPNGTGTSLKLENLSIERVTDRDTPQETIDPSPTGTDVPSSVQSTETIVAGQPTAKTLVTAQPNQGQDTWQLRMPFDKISLNLPANAGKKGTVYKAKLTWSLDDTP